MSASRFEFRYITLAESDNYAYYRIPKVIMIDDFFADLSYGAKILYGLLLDLVGLSRENRWTDDRGNVYVIYTVERVMRDMRCSEHTAVKMIRELTEIGLIDRKKFGQGKPSVIYVKSFMKVAEAEVDGDNSRLAENAIQELQQGSRLAESAIQELQGRTVLSPSEPVDKAEKPEISGEQVPGEATSAPYRCNSRTAKSAIQELQGESDPFRTAENAIQELQNVQDRTCRKCNSGTAESAGQELQNVQSINPKYNDHEWNETEYDQSNPSASGYRNPTGVAKEKRYDRNLAEKYIRIMIGYDTLLADGEEKEQIDGIVDLIADVLCSVRPATRVAREERPTEVVKAQLMKLNEEHIRYVLRGLREKSQAAPVRDMKQYLLTALYNAPMTIASSYDAMAARNSACG